MLCFLETPVLRFSLLPYYQRNKGSGNLKIRFMADLNKYESVGRWVNDEHSLKLTLNILFISDVIT